jgi:N-carbamoyl-L-amino-acid hydrolase
LWPTLFKLGGSLGNKKRAEMLKVDGERLWSDLMTMGAIGATERGGSSRAALSDADRDARNLFVYWAREAGLAITIDKLGNLFARREGADPGLPPVMVGSHLDTQSRRQV